MPSTPKPSKKRGSTTKDKDPEKRKRPRQKHAPSIVGMHHGDLKLEMLEIAGYNLEVADGEGFIGDRASQTAFRALLDQWRRRYRRKGLKDPLGKRPSSALGKKVLDKAIAAERASPAADIVHGAIEEFAVELAQVIQRFMRQKSWSGVQRIVIGGGFPESDVGERAILQAAALCEAAELPVHLARLSHHVDDGGLIGWVHLAPPALTEQYDALLALDLGGTNARCGIVSFRRNKAKDFSRARVERRVKWRHADDDPSRTGLVKGLAGLLEEQIDWAARKRLKLAPFVGIACPGLIRADGSIARGAQNLPGNWAADSFHLPTALREALPVIDGHATQVLMHNDAVVQGLSEVPRMRDVKRWAVLTIGTGLGNASYVNHRVAREAAD